jgi:hypothetical protein
MCAQTQGVVGTHIRYGQRWHQYEDYTGRNSVLQQRTNVDDNAVAAHLAAGGVTIAPLLACTTN